MFPVLGMPSFVCLAYDHATERISSLFGSSPITGNELLPLLISGKALLPNPLAKCNFPPPAEPKKEISTYLCFPGIGSRPVFDNPSPPSAILTIYSFFFFPRQPQSRPADSPAIERSLTTPRSCPLSCPPHLFHSPEHPFPLRTEFRALWACFRPFFFPSLFL